MDSFFEIKFNFFSFKSRFFISNMHEGQNSLRFRVLKVFWLLGLRLGLTKGNVAFLFRYACTAQAKPAGGGRFLVGCCLCYWDWRLYASSVVCWRLLVLLVLVNWDQGCYRIVLYIHHILCRWANNIALDVRVFEWTRIQTIIKYLVLAQMRNTRSFFQLLMQHYFLLRKEEGRVDFYWTTGLVQLTVLLVLLF